ncbi:MAG: hypothetical protein E3J73_04325 [Candidatus Bathyarchaeum sp.]|nr:MAG: hypothetical protein E3J73_04325 [Candidatus Bathyarchaeum sp.]
MSEMQIEEIKEKINQAIKAVADVEEPFRTKAFEIVLSTLLEGSVIKTSIKSRSSTETSTRRTNTLNQQIAEFAKKAGIESGKLRDFYDFEEDEPVFIGKVEGREAEKQIQISKCLLIAYESVYGISWVKTSILSKALDNYGVGSLNNLAKNLGKCRDDFRSKGQFRGTQYKLTQLGRESALNLLRQLSA